MESLQTQYYNIFHASCMLLSQHTLAEWYIETGETYKLHGDYQYTYVQALKSGFTVVEAKVYYVYICVHTYTYMLTQGD